MSAPSSPSRRVAPALAAALAAAAAAAPGPVFAAGAAAAPDSGPAAPPSGPAAAIPREVLSRLGGPDSTQSQPLVLETLPQFCAAPIYVDRIRPAPPITVPEEVLVAALRGAPSLSCRWRAAMLLGYLGTPAAPDALIDFALHGLQGEAGGEGFPVVMGALHGLGLYVRTHPGTPAAAAALAFLLEASDPEYWQSPHVTWSRPGVEAGAFAQDNAGTVLIALALTAAEPAWQRLDEAVAPTSPLAARAGYAVGLWCEARAGVTAPLLAH